MDTHEFCLKVLQVEALHRNKMIGPIVRWALALPESEDDRFERVLQICLELTELGVE